MTIHGSIYDYDAIHRALAGKEQLELEVRPFAGPNWNPPHLRQQAARLYRIIREPIAWCENPTRFGWGEPGLTWWCTSILAHDKNWSFPVDAELRSLGPVELPSTWRISHRRDEHKSIEIFDSFDAALAVLASDDRRLLKSIKGTSMSPAERKALMILLDVVWDFIQEMQPTANGEDLIHKLAEAVRDIKAEVDIIRAFADNRH